MTKGSKHVTRKQKMESGESKTAGKKKYKDDVSEKLKQFSLTETQKELVNTIRSNTITFVDSPAGSGKTSTVLWHFVKEYLTDSSKQIIVVRTPVEFTDDKIGYLPNSIADKVEPHFASARKILEDFLGKGKVDTDLEERIHFKVPNYMLGCTITNAFVLIDEAQQLSPQILKLLLERIGENTCVVVAGDSNQLFDAKGKRNGLADAIDRFFKVEGDWIVAKYDDIGFHAFGVQDIMRHEIVRTVVTAYSGMKGY